MSQAKETNIFNQQVLIAIEALSAEKKISSERVFNAIEEAISAVVTKRLPEGTEIQTTINKEDGSYEIHQILEVTDQLPDDPIDVHKYIHIDDAQTLSKNHTTGDSIKKSIESEALTRIGAHQAKQLLNRIFRQIEREKNLDKLSHNLNQIVNAEVIRASRKEILVEINDTEKGIIKEKDIIPNEIIRPGERIRAYLYKIDPDTKGPACYLSRSCNEFLVELFKMEVPEMTDGIITIKSAAREPGVRAKIAVNSVDKRVDAIGATIGMRGARVQEVSKELNGERIDIINWSDRPEEMVEAAMSPATISSIEIDTYHQSMQLAVKEENLAQAIGRNGQNIRLASQLTGWNLNIMTEEEALENNKKIDAVALEEFMEKMDIDQQIANILIREKIHSIEMIANSAVHTLTAIPEFSDDIAEEIINRAQLSLISDTISENQELEEMSKTVEKDFLTLPGMTPQIAKKLIDTGVKTKDDLAELSTEEITNITNLSDDAGGQLIMAARAHWFQDDQNEELS